jgi:GAF domain-containing protein
VTAEKASVILIKDPEHYKLVGRHGLSDGYAQMLNEAPLRLQHGRGPSGWAVETGRPTIIDDTELDERFTSRRPLSRSEGYRAMVSTPLTVDGEAIGTLNVYRAGPGDWTASDIDLLVIFAGAAANAIFTAQLLDRQGRQLAALQRLVRALREQAHEHANRIHTVGGLLAMGDICASRPTSTPTASTRSAACWRWATSTRPGAS